MKVSDFRRKRMPTTQFTLADGSKVSAVQLNEAVQALTARKGTFKLSVPDKIIQARVVRGKPGEWIVENVQLEKAVKAGRRLAKDAQFSRSTQLIRQDESSETTASIAAKFNETLEKNKNFYDSLLKKSFR